MLNYLGNDTPPYLGGRAVGLVAFGGSGAINALNALHPAVRARNGLSAPMVVAVPRNAPDAESSVVRDEAVRRRLASMVQQITDLSRMFRRPAAGVVGDGLIICQALEIGRAKCACRRPAAHEERADERRR